MCIDTLDYSITAVDSSIEEFCLAMLDALGLQFGAFDFIVDTSGELYFLEVNPNGQWYWLEDKTGALISDAIVSILKSTQKGGERRWKQKFLQHSVQ